MKTSGSFPLQSQMNSKLRDRNTTPQAGPGGDPGDLQQMGPANEELFAVDSTVQHRQRLLASAVMTEQKKAAGQVV